jgi:replicative DNA helicase
MSDYRRNGTANGNGRRLANGSGPALGELLGKLPPHDLESEMCLLGSLILAGGDNVHLIGEVMQIVRSPADFFMPKHGVIYEGIVKVYDQHSAIDLVQLGTWLKDKGHYETIGGQEYLIELAESVPVTVNAPYYAKNVRSKAAIRRVLDAAGKILRVGYESPDDADGVRDQAQRLMMEATADFNPPSMASMSELVQEAFDELEKNAANGNTLTGLPTGFGQLDQMTMGFQPGEMIVVGARPSMGKTAFATCIMEHMALVNRIPVLLISLEMNKRQLSYRLLSAVAGVSSRRMLRNMLDNDQIRALQDAGARLSASPIYIDDSSEASVMEFRSKARRMKRENNIGCIFIDYIQLMSSPGSENRQNEIASISRTIKAVGKELNIPIVALAQLNRQNESRSNKRPTLSDLKESGQIEQDADVVMLLHREDYYHQGEDDYNPNNEAELIIAKQRNGPTGVIKLHWHDETTRFANVAPSYLY